MLEVGGVIPGWSLFCFLFFTVYRSSCRQQYNLGLNPVSLNERVFLYFLTPFDEIFQPEPLVYPTAKAITDQNDGVEIVWFSAM